MTVATTTARGSAPTPCARATAMGTISAVVAVLDMKLVSAQVTIQMTSSSRNGEGVSPSA